MGWKVGFVKERERKGERVGGGGIKIRKENYIMLIKKKQWKTRFGIPARHSHHHHSLAQRVGLQVLDAGAGDRLGLEGDLRMEFRFAEGCFSSGLPGIKKGISDD